MQALLLIAIFTLFLGVTTSIITQGSNSSAQLRRQRIESTQEYFKNIDKVVNNDITPNQHTANVAGGVYAAGVADYIKNSPVLSQLSSGQNGGAGLDLWGKPLQGKIFTVMQTIYTAPGIVTKAPVTAFILISSGPDMILQTDVSKINTLLGLNGAVAATGSDDIVYAFTDEVAQRQQFLLLQKRVERIGALILQNYQVRLSEYRAKRLAYYKANMSSLNLADMMVDEPPCDINDPTKVNPKVPQDACSPTFIGLDTVLGGKDNTANRHLLGADEEIAQVEKVVPGSPNNGFVFLQSGVTGPNGSTLVIKVRNDAAHGRSSPWVNTVTPFSDLIYQYTVKGS